MVTYGLYSPLTTRYLTLQVARLLRKASKEISNSIDVVLLKFAGSLLMICSKTIANKLPSHTRTKQDYRL